MAFCSGCGTAIADGTTLCAACSAKAPAAAPAAGGMSDNVIGMLAYFTIIPAILFLVLEPYNKSKFVRFHCFQMIFFCCAMFALWMAFFILGFIPMLIFIMIPIHIIVWLGSFVVWLILVIKANQNQMFKLPFIGDLAAKQAGV